MFLVKNPCVDSGCSHLCLIKPDDDYECKCPENSNFIEGEIRTCDACKLAGLRFYLNNILNNI